MIPSSTAAYDVNGIWDLMQNRNVASLPDSVSSAAASSAVEDGANAGGDGDDICGFFYSHLVLLLKQ